jgi:membrane fusion protein (multidrug efflux system)
MTTVSTSHELIANEPRARAGFLAEAEKTIWPWLALAAVVATFIGCVGWRLMAPRPDVSTENAYVRVNHATIAPRIAGQVKNVLVDSNDSVTAGQLLVELDDQGYRASVAIAEATLSRDRALTKSARAATLHQQPIIQQMEAQVETAEAQLSFAESDAKRYQYLATTGSGTVKTQQQADSTLRQSKAALDAARASMAAARAQLATLKAQEESAQANVTASEAQLDQARLNLSYTRIVAPVSGMVAQRGVQVGNFVSAGAGLMAVVPINEVYVEANFREVELANVKAGQAARIHVDAYDIDLKGTVLGIPAATGATFSAIQPDSATGNFTKIVQRLPVRIAIVPGQPLAALLRVGLSVEVTISTHLEDVVGEYRREAKASPGR